MSNSLQILKGDMVFLLREQNEGLLKLLVIIALRHLGGHDVDEVLFAYLDSLFLLLAISATLFLAVVKVANVLFDLGPFWLKAKRS